MVIFFKVGRHASSNEINVGEIYKKLTTRFQVAFQTSKDKQNSKACVD